MNENHFLGTLRYIYTKILVHIQTCPHTYTYTHAHIHVCTHMCKCTQTNTETYMYIHTYIQIEYQSYIQYKGIVI